MRAHAHSIPAELAYLDDVKPQVLPTFATVVCEHPRDRGAAGVVPGRRNRPREGRPRQPEVTVHAPIPASGSAQTTTRIAGVDKGKAAVIVQESTTVALDGSPLWTARSSIFARGEGWFRG